MLAHITTNLLFRARLFESWPSVGVGDEITLNDLIAMNHRDVGKRRMMREFFLVLCKIVGGVNGRMMKQHCIVHIKK